jgi:hypothetical protein
MTTTRNRTRDLPDGPTTTYQLINNTGGVVYANSFLSGGGFQIMEDTVTPNFRESIADGEIINNPMSYYRYEWYDSAPGSISQYTTNPNKITTSCCGNVTHEYMDTVWDPLETHPPNNPPLDGEALENVAKQKCLSFVDRTPVALAEDLGEIRETIQFLKSPIQSIERLTRAFVNKKQGISQIGNALERAQAMADVWKTYRFAVGPLMRSVVDVLELTANKPPNRPKRQRASGRAQDTSNNDGNPYVWKHNIIYLSQQYRYESFGYRSLGYHATILYEVSNPLEDWKWKLGLRLKDLPTTGWELLPYSFMVDRLLDIRSMFAGLMNFLDPNVTFLAASVTERQHDMYTMSLSHMEGGGKTRWFTKRDWRVFDTYIQNRSVWQPSLSDTVPGFTPKNLVKDLTSIADLLAILLGFIPAVNPDL